jgi:hypothetical protein
MILILVFHIKVIDLAQSTAASTFKFITTGIDNDQAGSGELKSFNPSSSQHL